MANTWSVLFARKRPLSLKRQGMYQSVLEGMLATGCVTLTQGVFLTNFVLFLGANNFQISLITAIPFLVHGAFIVSPLLTQKMHSRSKVSALCSGLGRSLWLFCGAIPFLPVSPTAQIFLLLLTIAMASALQVIGVNAWLSWVADLVPRSVRGAFHGWRNIYSGITALLLTAAGAAVMDYFKGFGQEAHGYLLLFSVAVGFALLASFVMWRQPESADEVSESSEWRQMMVQPWRDPQFRPVLLFFALWNFSVGVPGSFFAVYQKTVLEWSFSEMGLFANLVVVSSLATFWLWGRCVDRVGPMHVMKKIGMWVSLLPLPWFFATQEYPWSAWSNAVISGALWAGFNIAAFNIAQQIAPAQGRQYYLGVLNMTNGLSMLIGILLGGAMAQWLPFELLTFGSWKLVSFHILFGLSGVGRFVSHRWLFLPYFRKNAFALS